MNPPCRYATVYALADVADSVGYILGPIVGFALCRLLRTRTGGLGLMGLSCAVLALPLLKVGSPPRA